MHAVFVAQLLFLVLIVMSVLLYKNQHRAKEFLLSFLNFEGVLAIEVRLKVAGPAVSCYHRVHSLGCRRAASCGIYSAIPTRRTASFRTSTSRGW